METLKIGDKVVLVALKDEEPNIYKGALNCVGIVAGSPQSVLNGFTAERELAVEVDFSGWELRPWIKNLQSAKQYYINRFKKDYVGGDEV